MPALNRLLSYYQSSLFIEDFTRLSERDPAAAKLHRQSISARFIENLTAEGFPPNEAEVRVQQAFTAGEMSMEEMLEHMKLYVASISARYSPR